MSGEKEYIIICDESDKSGPFYSNFYGGAIIGGSKYAKVSSRLESAKASLSIESEVKWSRVGSYELEGYKKLVDAFFDEMAAGNLRMRVMFSQNRNVPRNLTPEQKEDGYFILYYHFLKNGFGLQFAPFGDEITRIRFYLDQLPDQSTEKRNRFKDYLCNLSNFEVFRKSRIEINSDDIAEVNSKHHIILQCVDLVLGSIPFRLNNKHRVQVGGTNRRGKRTIAKDELQRHIRSNIVRVTGKTHFNSGISTGLSDSPFAAWSDPYRHWRFVPKDHEINSEAGKRKTKKPHST